MFEHLQRHAIAGSASIVSGPGGLPAVHVRTPAASGLIYLHGAHVAAWKPNGFSEVLWMSGKSQFEAGKPIRGGVPICFPWFGPKPAGTTPGPAHGIARLNEWQLESIRDEGGAITVSLALNADAASQTAWPHAFKLRHRVTFGATLTMALELTNTGDQPLTAEEALHTYFTVGDVKQVRVKGLAGVRYIDKVDGAKEKTQEGDITITGETDRVYLDTTAAVTLEDPALKRRITVSKEQSHATVVWNPWIAKAKAMPDFGDEEWPDMICIETCNVGKSALTVAPGMSHVMTARIAVAAL